MNPVGISRCDRRFDYYLKWLESENIKYKILDYHLDNFEDMKGCSSLLLTGGDDVFPEFYKDWDETKDRNNYKPERDGFEFKLLDYAFDNEIPVLGICRGLQLINVKMNGNLLSDIETIRHTNHKKIDDQNDRIHDVTVTEGSILSGIVGVKIGVVNSSHHQGIDRLGEGLKVTARSNDGIIEAVEWIEGNSKPFLLAVQWHPERMKDQSNPFTHKLLRKFKEVSGQI